MIIIKQRFGFAESFEKLIIHLIPALRLRSYFLIEGYTHGPAPLCLKMF